MEIRAKVKHGGNSNSLGGSARRRRGPCGTAHSIEPNPFLEQATVSPLARPGQVHVGYQRTRGAEVRDE